MKRKDTKVRKREKKKEENANQTEDQRNEESAKYVSDHDSIKNTYNKEEYENKAFNPFCAAWHWIDDVCRCCTLACNNCRDFPKATIAQVFKYAQTGDIVLFDNDCNLGTCIISCFTRSDWDHVGMVVRKPGLDGAPSESPNDIHILESLGSGVEFDTLRVVWESYYEDPENNPMYWRPLIHPEGKCDRWPNGQVSKELAKKLWDFANDKKGKPYAKGAGDMVDSAISQDAVCWNECFGECCCERRKYEKQVDGKTVQDESFFCSQLIAAAYQEAELVDVNAKDESGESKVLSSENYLPKDFSSDPHNNLQDVMKETKYKLHDIEIKITPMRRAQNQAMQSKAGGGT